MTPDQRQVIRTLDAAASLHQLPTYSMLVALLIEERRIRRLGQEPDMHWESLRDERRAAYAATDAAISQAVGA